MQGGEGPLPKGSVGGSQRTLEPCRGKRQKANHRKGPADSREHTGCAVKKVIGTQAGPPARPFISPCGSAKSGRKFRDNGNTCGFVSGVGNERSLFAGKRGRKRPPVKCARFPERILPVRSSPVQPFLLTAAEAFRRALLKGFSLRLLLEGP